MRTSSHQRAYPSHTGAESSGSTLHQQDLDLLLRRLETPTPHDIIARNENSDPLEWTWVEEAPQRAAFLFNDDRELLAGQKKLAPLYGYVPEAIDASDAGWEAIIHPEDLPQLKVAHRDLCKNQIELASVQVRIICQDGHWEWVQQTWRALERTASGKLVRGIALLQVITPMALATQALRNEAALNALSRMLVEEWVEGLFLLDTSWGIVYASQRALDSLGYTQQDLHGRSLLQITVMDQSRRKSMPTFKTDEKQTLRATHLRKDGSSFPVEITLRGLGGKLVLAITRDIREQLTQEENSRRQTAYYRGLFENNPCGVVVFDQYGRLTEANPALHRMLGYAGRQFHNMRVQDLLAAESELPDSFWEDMLEATGRQSQETEAVLRRRDGRLLHVHMSVTFVASAAPTSNGYGIIIFTDISARKLAEEGLRRQSELNDMLVRESAALISMLDRDGRILKVNPSIEQASGFRAAELEGRPLWESRLFSKAESGRMKEALRRLEQGEPRVNSIVRSQTRSGDIRILDVHKTATRDPDGFIEHYIINAIDVTEKQRLQHQLMEAVEQEQARIGHDLHDGVGQLLTGIGAMTEMLQLRLEGKNREEAQHIHELISQAIHQVRQLSRNMSPAAVENRDLSASLILLADTVRTSFRRQCECQISPDVTITDQAVATHLFRIAQEAVNNAIRHGKPNHIWLKLSPDEEPGYGLLEILNDGETFDCQPGKEGIGLNVMNYRSSLIHANFSISCPLEGGVRVACKFLIR